MGVCPASTRTRRNWYQTCWPVVSRTGVHVKAGFVTRMGPASAGVSSVGGGGTDGTMVMVACTGGIGLLVTRPNMFSQKTVIRMGLAGRWPVRLTASFRAPRNTSRDQSVTSGVVRNVPPTLNWRGTTTEAVSPFKSSRTRRSQRTGSPA